jgi:hypothetical protein
MPPIHAVRVDKAAAIRAIWNGRRDLKTILIVAGMAQRTQILMARLAL